MKVRPVKSQALQYLLENTVIYIKGIRNVLFVRSVIHINLANNSQPIDYSIPASKQIKEIKPILTHRKRSMILFSKAVKPGFSFVMPASLESFDLRRRLIKAVSIYRQKTIKFIAKKLI